MKFKKKPDQIEAVQWNNHGDHSSVKKEIPSHCDHVLILDEKGRCEACKKEKKKHGWLPMMPEHFYSGFFGYLVCPGQWIVTGTDGNLFPMSQENFESAYEPV